MDVDRYHAYTSHLLVTGYHVLNRFCPVDGSRQESVTTSTGFYEDGYCDTVRPVLSDLVDTYRRHLDQFFYAGYIIGSMASRDYVLGLSDLDILLVLGQETVSSESTLNAAKSAYRKIVRHQYQIDPLQHHFPFVITEPDMAFYPFQFYPLNLLSPATCMGRNAQRLVFYRRNSETDIRERLVNGLQAFQSFNRQHRPPGEYQLKSHLQVAQFLPVLLCQVYGDYLEKPDAYQWLRERARESGMLLIDTLSRMRREVRFDPVMARPLAFKYLQCTNIKALQRRAPKIQRRGIYSRHIDMHVGTWPDIQALCNDLADEIRMVGSEGGIR
jgi:hypothetical protein